MRDYPRIMLITLCILTAASCSADDPAPGDGAPGRADHALTDGPHVDGVVADAAVNELGGGDGPTADLPRSDLQQPDVAPLDLSPDTNPVPTVPVLPHKTDFLNVGCRTHTYGGLSAAKRKACRTAVKKRGYTHFYLYAYNEKDYGGPAFNYYLNIAGFKVLLNELIADGLTPVVWLFPDDAPKLLKDNVTALKAKMTALIPKVDHLVSSYCLGLELDEYWNGAKVNMLGLHLRSMTSKKIAVHQTNGKWSYAKYSWVDYMILQYGFGKTTSFIKSMTAQCIADLKKPVVAGEYALDNEAKGIALGNAAVSAGAKGFGNGGKP